MSAIDVLISLVKEFEGCKLRAYKCSAGVWTVGYGHTEGVTSGTVITQSQAETMLHADCEDRLQMALTASPPLVNATPGQQAAVADFIFNVGLGAYKSSTFKKNIDVGRFDLAKESVKLWNKATDPNTGRKVVLKGLVRRRQAESDLL